MGPNREYIMNLDEAQRKRVAEWIKEGLKLSEIQTRIVDEFGINMTYMDVRFLVDDLKLMPKDIEPVKAPELGRADAGGAGGGPSPAQQTAPPPGGPRGVGGVSVRVAEVARPGSVVSGNVTFGDGNSAEWYLDQTGRLGLVPAIQGYRPSDEDVRLFQAELQSELARMGF
jgi:hypothetical protein